MHMQIGLRLLPPELGVFVSAFPRPHLMARRRRYRSRRAAGAAMRLAMVLGPCRRTARDANRWVLAMKSHSSPAVADDAG